MQTKSGLSNIFCSIVSNIIQCFFGDGRQKQKKFHSRQKLKWALFWPYWSNPEKIREKSGLFKSIFFHGVKKKILVFTPWKKILVFTPWKKILVFTPWKKKSCFYWLTIKTKHFIMLSLLNKATCSIYILQLKVVS